MDYFKSQLPALCRVWTGREVSERTLTINAIKINLCRTLVGALLSIRNVLSLNWKMDTFLRKVSNRIPKSNNFISNKLNSNFSRVLHVQAICAQAMSRLKRLKIEISKNFIESFNLKPIWSLFGLIIANYQL